MSIRERLGQHWFAPARVRDLAYLRIALVGVMLAGSMWPGALDHQLRLTLLPAEWFEALPALKLLTAPLEWGWGVRPGALLVTSMWMLCGAAGLFALVGAHTRLSLALFAYANTFLIAHAFSYGTLQHPQAPPTIILFVLLLTPCGEALSVDSMRKRVAESRRRGEFIPRDGEATSANARWPLRLTQWLLVAVYLSAGVSKLVVGKGAWMNGYTMGYYLLLDGFGHQLPLSIAIAHVHWLGVVSAVVTLAFELTFVVSVLWPRTFPAYGAVGTGLHTGIFLLMRAPFFQFVAMYAAWAEALRHARLAIFATGEHRVWTIVYDGHCPLCVRTMSQLEELDGGRRLRFVDLERDLPRAEELVPGVSIEELRKEIVVVTPDGRALRGFLAVRELSKRLVVLWVLVPMMFAPGAEWIGTRVYAWVARRRARRVCAVIDFGGSAS